MSVGTAMRLRYPQIEMWDFGRSHREAVDPEVGVTILRDIQLKVDGSEWTMCAGIKFDFPLDAYATVTFRVPPYQVCEVPGPEVLTPVELSSDIPRPWFELAWLGTPFLSDVLGCRMDGVPRPITEARSVARARETFVDITMGLGTLEMR